MLQASGKYVKLISPGDYIFNEYVLRRWVDIMNKDGMQICFGKAACYSYTRDGVPMIIRINPKPINRQIYSSEGFSNKVVIYNYLFLKDVPYGCCFMTEKELLISYLKKFQTILYMLMIWYIKLCLVMEKIYYYNETVIWYEYGTGISTCNNKKWNDILKREGVIINEYLIKHNNQKGIFKIKFLSALIVTKKQIG